MNQLARIDTTALSNLNRALIGFDRMFDDIDRLHIRSDNYPPHNIIRTGENNYVIELAVAGFSKDEVNVQVENNQLTITGQKSAVITPEGQEEPSYLHRGLAMRDIHRVFPLAEHIYVNGASIKDGILIINLERRVPEALKPRTIDIIQG